MPFNPNFEGEDIEKLLATIAKGRENRIEPRDRTVHAPLAHRMVHMNEDQDYEDDNTRPGEDVTKKLANIFAHLSQATVCLGWMHRVLGQVHVSICPENLLLHYGRDGEIVYLLNDFDSEYTRRLKPDMYGEKALPKEDGTNERNPVYDYYTYEDMKRHFESMATS